MTNINGEIFKTYDIRGVYKKELDEKAAYLSGRAFVTFLGKESPVLAVGRDGRSSSPSLFKELKRGIVDSGGKVIDMGICNTPLLNLSVAKNKFDGGVMVTASHSPPEFNGLKLVKEKALQIYGEDIKKIKQIIEKEEFVSKKGEEKKGNFLSDYIEYVFSLASDIEGIKIVVDCGNGVGAVTAKPLFEKLKVDALFLNEKVDGSFPNHLPDPFDLNSIKTVSQKIKEKKADLGVLFDGDADRCVLLDEKGEMISTDILLSFLAKEELKNNPQEEIYHDLRFSMATSEDIKKFGGIPVMMRVGNPFYKEKIINEGGLLGAELSGHIMFRENFGIDDGLFALIKTLKLLSKEKAPVSKVLSSFQRYFQTEEINLKVKDKKEALRQVKSAFSDGESVDLDGVYIKYENWWFNLRKSNTEDLVRLRIEAQEKEILEEKKDALVSIIEKC